METNTLLKKEKLNVLIETGIVAVIRANSADELLSISKALSNGGVIGIEITMTSPGALMAIDAASKELSNKAIIGAGSVLDPETARVAILAGAEFIVSPILNLEIIKLCKRYSKIVVPGAFTPTEILAAWQAGADIVKIFPATKLGPSFIKDIRGPLPQIKLSPTGGVDMNNLSDYLEAGAAFVGVGQALVKKEFVENGNWEGLTKLAREYVRVVKDARGISSLL